LKIKQTPIDELIPYALNSRTHSDEQVAQIAASIKEFGFNNPVLLDKENGIIAGHGRVLAARKLGLKEIPTIELSHLTDTQRKAYVIADNKLALNAGWDDDLLKLEMQGLGNEKFDLTLTGFSIEELDGLFFEPNFESGNEDDQGDLDKLDPKMVVCPHCGGNFDLRDNGQG
jgi:ParB-like chromosome segregation protein Spo0J